MHVGCLGRRYGPFPKPIVVAHPRRALCVPVPVPGSQLSAVWLRNGSRAAGDEGSQGSSRRRIVATAVVVPERLTQEPTPMDQVLLAYARMRSVHGILSCSCGRRWQGTSCTEYSAAA